MILIQARAKLVRDKRTTGRSPAPDHARPWATPEPPERATPEPDDGAVAGASSEQVARP